MNSIWYFLLYVIYISQTYIYFMNMNIKDVNDSYDSHSLAET